MLDIDLIGHKTPAFKHLKVIALFLKGHMIIPIKGH